MNDIWGSEHLFEWKSTLWEHDLDNGLRLLRLAIDTHLITSHHALPLLVRNPGGLVVEVTDGTAAYNADHYRVGCSTTSRRRRSSGWPGGWRKELAPHGGTAVALTPGWMRSELMLEHHGVSESNWRDATERTPHFCISESPRFVGRAVAALAGDPDVSRWNGQSLSSGELAQVYGFTDTDGTQPDCWRYMVEVVEREGATAGDERLPLSPAQRSSARTTPSSRIDRSVIGLTTRIASSAPASANSLRLAAIRPAGPPAAAPRACGRVPRLTRPTPRTRTRCARSPRDRARQPAPRR